jgi:hypothetical protein
MDVRLGWPVYRSVGKYAEVALDPELKMKLAAY